MFCIDMSPKFPVQVRFEVTGPEGQRQVQAFEASVLRMTVDELQALQQRITAESLSDRDVARSLLRGWSGVADTNGNELVFSPDNLGRVLNIAGVASAIIAAFRAGQPRAAAGN